MSELVDIALPCRLISLKIRIGPEQGVTTLEELAAKAVLAGRTSVERLAELFGLPRRLLLDVVLGLWGRGYISVDMESGVIELSDTAREILVGGGGLSDAAIETEDRQFLFEPVTGRVLLPEDGMQYPPGGTLQAPLSHGIRESDLPQDELLRAVQLAIRQDRRRGSRKTVLEVSFGHPVLRPVAKLRWLVVTAGVTIDPDSERLAVTLADTRRWDARSADMLRQHMAALADAEPSHPFVQALRGQADRRFNPPESTDALFERFSEAVGRLDRADPAALAERHRELSELHARLADRVAAVEQARASVTVVSRAAGHAWATEMLIDEARTQLVIVAPMIGYRALNPLLPALRAALDRRVQLVVVWGRTPGDSLQAAVRAAFDELAIKYKSRVMVADRSARTDACAVIADDTRALVGSRSLFEMDPGRDHAAASVLVEPVGGGSGPTAAVSGLLDWVRGVYPYWQDSQRIVTRRPGAAVAGEQAPAVPAALDDVAEHADEAAVHLLAAAWGEYRATLADVLQQGEAIGPVVDVIADGRNHEFLWNAIRNARRRLVLADDNVDPALLKKVLNAARERQPGGTCDVICASTTARKVFAEQKGERQPDIRLHQQAPATRLVVADDEALIGSYSPLGDDGSRLAAGDERHQLTVRIAGRAVATELARLVWVTTADDGPAETGSLPPRTRSAAAAAGPLLVEARRERQHGRYGAFAAARFAGLDQPWDVLDAWRDQEVPAADLRPAVAVLMRQTAAALRTAPDEHPAALRWSGWLLEDCWQRSQFVAAAVLAGLVPDSGVTPSPAACLAVAPVETGPLGESVTGALLALSDADVPAAAAGAAGALAEMMLWAGPLGQQGVNLLGEALPASWRDFAAAAERFWADSRGAPVPVGAIAAQLSRWDEAAKSESDWAALASRIDKLQQRRFTFESGIAMHTALFSPDGLLTRIRVAARDDVEARQSLAASLPADIMQYLNGLVTAAGTPTAQWHKHLHFIEDMTDLVRSARTLAATQPPAGAVAAAIRSPACRELAAAAAKGRNELLADANGLPHPYGLPLRALLDRLEPLIRWGEM